MKNVFQLSHKKHSSKEVVPITYPLEKKFSTTATFEGLREASFQTVKKLVSYYGLYVISFQFYRKENQVNTAYKK